MADPDVGAAWRSYSVGAFRWARAWDAWHSPGKNTNADGASFVRTAKAALMSLLLTDTSLKRPSILEDLPKLPYENPESLLVSCAQPEVDFRPGELYSPGVIEKMWIRSESEWRAAGQVCALSNAAAHVSATKLWLDYARVARGEVYDADGVTASRGSTRTWGRPRSGANGLRKSIAGKNLMKGDSFRKPPAAFLRNPVFAAYLVPTYTPLMPAQPNARQRPQLSYVRGGDEMMQPIEPLTGMGRHPLSVDLCGNSSYRGKYAATSVFNTSHLIIANQCDWRGHQRNHTRRSHVCTKNEAQHYIAATVASASPTRAPTLRASARGPRNILYDLGCKEYETGELRSTPGSKRGGTIPLFARMYEQRCVGAPRRLRRASTSRQPPPYPVVSLRGLYARLSCTVFDYIHGWEKAKYRRSHWWSRVPQSMSHRVVYRPVAVREGNMSSVLIDRVWSRPDPNTSPTHIPNSFLRHLYHSATEADFVVVKLDMKGGPEEQILNAIAYVPELRRLVDELFFQWHHDADDTRSMSVDHALRTMQKMRHHGVRTHFWV